MKVIRIHHPLNHQLIPDGAVVLAMGFFDGVHRGHQQVIRRARAIADQRKLPLAALTYNHAPAIVYRRIDGGAHYLNTLDQKATLMNRLGVNILYVIDFTSQYGAQQPADFVNNYLMAFHPAVVVAGDDHTFGSGPNATMQALPQLAAGRFEVVEVPTLVRDAQKIGTSQIRQQIQAGEMAAANASLGYRYRTVGLVVHGFARGRQIGFPTINIESPVTAVMPPLGVYVTRVKVAGRWYDGMANIGYNETFGDNAAKTLEINLFDFHQEVYGEEVEVEWYYRLRDGKKFANVDALIDQMKEDRQLTVTYLATHPRIDLPTINK